MIKEYTKITDKDSRLIKRLETGTPREKRFAEVFKKIIINDDFREFVKKIRNKLSIPEDGLDLDNKKHLEIFNKCIKPGGIADGQYVYRPYISLDQIKKGCDKEVSVFLESKDNYELEKEYFYHNHHSINISLPVAEYILTGDVIPTDTEMIELSRTFYKKESEEDMIKNPWFYKILKEDGLDPFVMDESIEISFSPNVTKKELLEYIEKNWIYIRALKDHILGKDRATKRIKSKKNFFRDIYILQKFEEFKKAGEKYPELRVASFLKKEREIFLSEGAIRSIVSKARKFL